MPSDPSQLGFFDMPESAQPKPKRTTANMPTDDTVLRLTYDLYELPSAQHKAGLAGLLLLIRHMEPCGFGPPPVIEALAHHRAEISLTQASLQAIFDNLYAAEWDEIRSKAKWQGKEPKRIETIENGETGKSDKFFIYDEFRPSGHLFRHLLNGGAQSPWLKLWQDMLWSVLRAQPATRIEYQRRADGEPAAIATTVWAQLLKARTKGGSVTDGIAGSVYIGAQDRNAERVPFAGLVETNLLLHFWQLVTPVFVPQTIDIKKERRAEQGFLLCIPEVADLEHFLELIEPFWQRLSPATPGNYYRPKEALIDLPEEGGLEYLYHLGHHTMATGTLHEALVAVELYHQEKQGNNVRMLASRRIQPDRYTLERYAVLRGQLSNPLLKALRIRNLLHDRPWHTGAIELFTQYPWTHFIRTPATPNRFRCFGQDAKVLFRATDKELTMHQTEGITSAKTADLVLASRIYQLIRAYVEHETDQRSPIKRKDLPKNDKGYPIYSRDYRDAREKVTSGAFLAIRGRNAQDFVSYFIGTICSVPQYLPEEEYRGISQALIEDPETVKNLAMLALSAHSYLPGQQDESSEATE